ncbi:hypothetical protein niasHT_025135 [Heterodera trifolii]|uniref:14-3-3 domain-containing protein n=1 Tax=Heterodera trifolii TaxID=157864 RepID=A0ABD2K1E0_9BILA
MMADEMKKAVKLDPNLDREERRLLGKAFNRLISVRRAAWQTLLLAEQRGSVYAKDEDLQQAARRSVVCKWKNSCLSQSDFQTRGDVFFAVVCEDISAMLVKKMKESAEQFIDGKTVTVAFFKRYLPDRASYFLMRSLGARQGSGSSAGGPSASPRALSMANPS